MSKFILSKEDFVKIFKHTKDSCTPFENTDQAYRKFVKDNNLKYDTTLVYEQKEYKYLELFNYTHLRRFTILP